VQTIANMNGYPIFTRWSVKSWTTVTRSLGIWLTNPFN